MKRTGSSSDRAVIPAKLALAKAGSGNLVPRLRGVNRVLIIKACPTRTVL